VSPDRQRHPNKELEAVCQAVEAAGWRVERKKGYYKAYCPCGQHLKTIVLTPSGANYVVNLTHWFRRQPCWPKDVP